MTVEQVLRRIERECRESEKLQCYVPRWRDDKSPVMKGARGEARGAMDQCEDIRALCRKLRREHSMAQLDSMAQLEMLR